MGVTTPVTISAGLNNINVYAYDNDGDLSLLDTVNIYGVTGALTCNYNELAWEYLDQSLLTSSGAVEGYHSRSVIQIGSSSTYRFLPGVGCISKTLASGMYLITGQTVKAFPSHLPFFYTTYSTSDSMLTSYKFYTSAFTVNTLTYSIDTEHCEADGIVYRNWLGGYSTLPCTGRTVYSDSVTRNTVTVKARRYLAAFPRSARDYFTSVKRAITVHTGCVLPMDEYYRGASFPVQGTAIAEIMSSPEVYFITHAQPLRLVPVVVADSSVEYKDMRTGLVSYTIKMTAADAALEAMG